MRRRLLTVAAVVAAATMIVAPFVSLGVGIALGLAWLPRFRRWAWPVVAVALVASASAWLVPPSWPPLQRTPAQSAAMANLLTSGGVVNAEGVAAWRVDGAEVWRPADADAVGPGAACMRLEAGGRVFQVADWPHELRSVRAVARLSDVPVDAPISGVVLELRVGAHGGSTSGIRFAAPFASVLDHVHAIDAAPVPDRLVASIWNRGVEAVELCVDRFAVVPESAAAAGLPPSPLALAALAPAGAAGRVATAVQLALRLALLGLTWVAWDGLWRRRAHALRATLVAASFAVPGLLLTLQLIVGLADASWLPHRNVVAAGLAATLLLALPSMHGRRLRAAAVVSVAAACVMLDARATGVALLVALLLAILWYRRAAFVAVSAGVALAIASAPWTRAAWVGLDETRVRVFEAAWSAVLRAPWSGYGYARSADVLLLEQPEDPIQFAHAHNVFLELAIETGVLGAGMGLVLVAVALVVAYRASPWHGGAVVVLILTSLVDTVLLAPTGYVSFACVVASAWVARSEARPPRRPLRSTHTRSGATRSLS